MESNNQRHCAAYVEYADAMRGELENNPKYTIFYQVAHQIADILARKNHDYGDSFHKLYEKFGDVGTFMRLFDKLGRLETLIQGNEQIKDEPIEDVFKDIAGYCILTLVSKEILKKQSVNPGQTNTINYGQQEES